jgi:hypothetical protein
MTVTRLALFLDLPATISHSFIADLAFINQEDKIIHDTSSILDHDDIDVTKEM